MPDEVDEIYDVDEFNDDEMGQQPETGIVEYDVQLPHIEVDEVLYDDENDIEVATDETDINE